MLFAGSLAAPWTDGLLPWVHYRHLDPVRVLHLSHHLELWQTKPYCDTIILHPCSTSFAFTRIQYGAEATEVSECFSITQFQT